MKRLSAILFMLVLVFNLYGYRLVITYLATNSQAHLEQQLDKNAYSDAELISIKTVLNLPYYQSSPDFDRAYGSVTVEGVVYEYVKKRVYRDTLELLCLPNAVKTALQGAENELVKTTVDGQASVPAKKGAATIKISLPDFCQELETFAPAAASTDHQFFLLNEPYTGYLFSKQPERPPQAI